MAVDRRAKNLLDMSNLEDYIRLELCNQLRILR